MKRYLKNKWIVLAASLVLTLSIGGAAFAAAGSSSTDTTTGGTAATATGGATDTQKGADNDQGFGHQRSDETLLTGDALTNVQAAAVAKVGNDATVERVETDADGNAKYEVHMVQADGTRITVYVDESYNVVSVEEGGPGGPGGSRCDGDQDGDQDGAGYSGGHRGERGADDNDNDTGSSTTTGSGSSSSLPAATSPTY